MCGKTIQVWETLQVFETLQVWETIQVWEMLQVWEAMQVWETIQQSYFSAPASNNITKPCEYLACVKIVEKCSQASPAKLLTFMKETCGLPQTGTCFICY